MMSAQRRRQCPPMAFPLPAHRQDLGASCLRSDKFSLGNRSRVQQGFLTLRNCNICELQYSHAYFGDRNGSVVWALVLTGAARTNQNCPAAIGMSVEDDKRTSRSRSSADIRSAKRHVRYIPESGH